MPTLQESMLIAAPIKRVYTFLADIERVPEWLPHVVETERTSEIRSGEGAELTIVMNAAGRQTEGTSRCVEAVSPHRLVFESSLAIGLTSTMAFDLTADGRQSTEVAVTLDYALAGRRLGRLVGGLFGDKMARRDVKAALDNLKARIEAEPARPARRKAAAKR
jgi:uncharacterized membrane protein